METAGNVLKTERETQKRSLNKIAETLKINVEYLRAIENDDYEIIPAEVFTKAYLSMYAEKLGLDTEYISKLYDSRLNLPRTVKTKALPDKIIIPVLQKIFQHRKNYKISIVILSVVLILTTAFILTKYLNQGIAQLPSEPSGAETDFVKEPETLSLKIKATELTWISVSIDGGKPGEWLLKAGEEITVKASEVFALKIGNAGGTRLALNNEDLGELGPHGKVIDIVLPEDIE